MEEPRIRVHIVVALRGLVVAGCDEGDFSWIHFYELQNPIFRHKIRLPNSILDFTLHKPRFYFLPFSSPPHTTAFSHYFTWLLLICLVFHFITPEKPKLNSATTPNRNRTATEPNQTESRPRLLLYALCKRRPTLDDDSPNATLPRLGTATTANSHLERPAI